MGGGVWNFSFHFLVYSANQEREKESKSLKKMNNDETMALICCWYNSYWGKSYLYQASCLFFLLPTAIVVHTSIVWAATVKMTVYL